MILILSEMFFKFNNYFFSSGTATTDRLDDTGKAFLGLTVLVFKTVLKLQTNLMTVYR